MTRVPFVFGFTPEEKSALEEAGRNAVALAAKAQAMIDAGEHDQAIDAVIETIAHSLTLLLSLPLPSSLRRYLDASSLLVDHVKDFLQKLES